VGTTPSQPALPAQLGANTPIDRTVAPEAVGVLHPYPEHRFAANHPRLRAQHASALRIRKGDADFLRD